MRIVGGAWRGRELTAPRGRDETRPTTDRLREALASAILAASGLSLEGVSVLDGFAGSGAVGFELLSRGAVQATFVEEAKPALAAIRRNAASLGAEDKTRIVAGDIFALASRGYLPGSPFDIAFFDPPYALEASEVATLIDTLITSGALGTCALVVYEHAAHMSPVAPSKATIIRTKVYKTAAVDFMRVEESS